MPGDPTDAGTPLFEVTAETNTSVSPRLYGGRIEGSTLLFNDLPNVWRGVRPTGNNSRLSRLADETVVSIWRRAPMRGVRCRFLNGKKTQVKLG